MIYKLRSECSQDVADFIALAHNQMKRFSMNSDSEGLPDCEFEFETDLALDEIIFILKEKTFKEIRADRVSRGDSFLVPELLIKP